MSDGRAAFLRVPVLQLPFYLRRTGSASPVTPFDFTLPEKEEPALSSTSTDAAYRSGPTRRRRGRHLGQSCRKIPAIRHNSAVKRRSAR
jgi:hypothetical protein